MSEWYFLAHINRTNTKKQNIRGYLEVRQRVTGRSSYLCSGLSKSFSVSDVFKFCIKVSQEDFNVLALIEDRQCLKHKNLKELKTW